MSLDNKWITEKIKEEIKYPRQKTQSKNICDHMKSVLKGNLHDKSLPQEAKKKISGNNLTLHLMQLEKNK